MEHQSIPPFPLAGELAALSAALIWSCTTTVFRRYGAAISPMAINAYKNLVALICLILALFVVQPDWPRDPLVFLGLASSGIIGLSLGDTALFAALRRLGAQITAATQCLAPPISAAIAGAFLGESLTRLEATGMAITTLAVFLLIHFGRRGVSPMAALPPRELLIGIGAAVVAALGQGLGVVLSRYSLQFVDSLLGTFLRIAPAFAVLAMILAWRRESFDPRPVLASRRQALMVTAASVAGTFVGLILMSIGAKYAKAGVAASLAATYPVWIIPVARFGLGERVGWRAAACAVVAVGGIVVMLLR